MVEHEAEGPDSGEADDAPRKSGKRPDQRQHQGHQAAGCGKHPPDEDGLVTAALDQQIPESVHQRGEQDQSKGK